MKHTRSNGVESACSIESMVCTLYLRALQASQGPQYFTKIQVSRSSSKGSPEVRDPLKPLSANVL